MAHYLCLTHCTGISRWLSSAPIYRFVMSSGDFRSLEKALFILSAGASGNVGEWRDALRQHHTSHQRHASRCPCRGEMHASRHICLFVSDRLVSMDPCHDPCKPPTSRPYSQITGVGMAQHCPGWSSTPFRPGSSRSSPVPNSSCAHLSVGGLCSHVRMDRALGGVC